MENSVLDQPTGKTALYEDLKREILTLERAPGSNLDEVSLSALYGLSRTPLREVLRELAGEGYVEMRTNRGAQVSAMSHKTLRDFFLAAPMIYAAISRLAAEAATPEQITELRQVQQDFRAAIDQGEVQDRVFLNDRFHALIGEMADNPYLTASLRRLLIDHARIGATFYRPRDEGMRRNLARAADDHDRFIACIEAGDGDAASKVAIEHWQLSRDRIEIFITPDGLDVPLGDRLEMGGQR